MEKQLSRLYNMREELQKMLAQKQRKVAELQAQMSQRESELDEIRLSVKTAEATDAALRQAISKFEETESDWKHQNEKLEASLAEKRSRIEDHGVRITQEIVNSGARTFDCVKKFCNLTSFYDVQDVKEKTDEYLRMYAQLKTRRDHLVAEKQRLSVEVEMKKKEVEAKQATEKMIPSPVVVDLILRKMRSENKTLALEVMNYRGKLKRTLAAISPHNQ
ncbi:hypothetical protein D918_05882 [Trichuris suis]|uniref:Uncharacterized protein n=1 Tax=Trichuris suis TaxID=68888 RepID=A0A085MG78_9BILA|nr:hypothetical protein M513_03002 [Trichuris suis]KHJ43830.1 hypothetical protein D918_05882 [Trichuris suis]